MFCLPSDVNHLLDRFHVCFFENDSKLLLKYFHNFLFRDYAVVVVLHFDDYDCQNFNFVDSKNKIRDSANLSELTMNSDSLIWLNIVTITIFLFSYANKGEH